jgi:hypothetical protein
MGDDLSQDHVTGRVYKVSSIQGGGVSLVFHVDPDDADMALGYMHLRGQTVELRLSFP